MRQLWCLSNAWPYVATCAHTSFMWPSAVQWMILMLFVTLFIDCLSNSEIVQCVTVYKIPNIFSFWTRACRIAESDFSFLMSCLSVCPHGTTWLPLDWFSWDFFLFHDFSKICRKYSSLIAIWREYRIFDVTNCIHLRQKPAELYLKWGKLSYRTWKHPFYVQHILYTS